MQIITNNVPRDVVEAYELPVEVRKEFDYLDWTGIEAREASASFVQYKGQWYDLGEFTRTYNEVMIQAGWHGIQEDSFFSGILIRYVDNFERVVVGRYYI